MCYIRLVVFFTHFMWGCKGEDQEGTKEKFKKEFKEKSKGYSKIQS